MMNKRHNQKIYRIIFASIILWFFLGLIIAYPSYRQVYNLASFNKLPLEERNLNLYGADYEIYKFLQNKSPRRSKILFLIPDVYYLPKSVFFLYPRQIKVVGSLKELEKSDFKKYDYLLIYYPLEKYSGVIKGLDSLSKSWALEQLFLFYKNKIIKKDIVFNEFIRDFENNRGLFLIKLI